MLRTTNSSPGWASKITSGETREFAAANDHDVRRLAPLGEFAIAVALGRHPPDEKVAIALDQAKREFRHVRHESSFGPICIRICFVSTLAMRGPAIAMHAPGSASRSQRRIMPAQDDAGLALRVAWNDFAGRWLGRAENAASIRFRAPYPSACFTRSRRHRRCRRRTPVSPRPRWRWPGDQRRRHLADAGRMVVGRDQVDEHLRDLVHARHAIVVEIRLLDRAVLDGDALRQRKPKPVDHAALGLRDDVVGLDRDAGIERDPDFGTLSAPVCGRARLRRSARSACPNSSCR